MLVPIQSHTSVRKVEHTGGHREVGKQIKLTSICHRSNNRDALSSLFNYISMVKPCNLVNVCPNY